MKRLKYVLLVLALACSLGCIESPPRPPKGDNSIVDNSIQDDILIQSDTDSDVEVNEDEVVSIWENLKGNMSDDEYSSLEKYIPLFEDNEKFYFFAVKEERSFKDLANELDETFTITDLALVDMDGNGVDELILYSDYGPGMTFVITMIDSEYYGSFFSAREMTDIQNNGAFIGSGGDGRESFNQLEISKENMVAVSFAQKPGIDEEEQWTDEYYENFLNENYADDVIAWKINFVVEKDSE